MASSDRITLIVGGFVPVALMLSLLAAMVVGGYFATRSARPERQGS